MEFSKPYVIAEVGCNHKGNIDIAKDLIKIAAEKCKVNAIKFQKRCNKELLTKEQYEAPHPNPINAYGKTYGEHREFLEFPIEVHVLLKRYCEEHGVDYSTSVWDITSAKEIASLNPKFIKIPSACNNNKEMLTWLCENYKGQIYLSIGMTTQSEQKWIVELFENQGRNDDLVLFACTSGYPVPFEDICLKEITRIREEFGNNINSVGFSGHHIGIAPDIAAYTLGAQIFERHYTLDQNWKGTDHSASLEPDELARLVDNLGQVYLSLNYKETEILPIEQVQRDKLKYRR